MDKSLQETLFEAMHRWLTEKNWRPYLQIDLGFPKVLVPAEFFKADKYLTVSVSYDAVKNLMWDVYGVSFEARFNGRPFHVELPWGSFVLTTPDDPFTPALHFKPAMVFTSNPSETKTTKPSLKLVK